MSEMPSHFVAVCPKCLVDLRVPLSFSGSDVQCKHCEHKFRVFVPDHLMTPSSAEFQTSSSLFDRVHGQPEGPQSAGAEPRGAEQQPQSAGELAAIREENARLGARLETRQQDHSGIQSAWDSLLVQLEHIRGDHDRLRSQHEQDRQEHQRLRDELASIRDALGGLSPDEIVVLRKERQSLGDENQRLRDQVQSLQTELSSGLGLAQIVADREEELHLARLQAEELKQRIEHLDEVLNGVHGERDQLGEQLRDLQAELEAERSRHAEQIAELHARAEANAQLAERLKAEILTIAQLRFALDADLEAAREEIADLRAELAATQTKKPSMSSLMEGMGIRLH